MNQRVLNKRTLKCKASIIILSLISLICTVVSCLGYFVYYSWHDSDNIFGYYKLTVSAPSVIGLLLLAIELAPCILLVLYLFHFYKKSKATVIVPTIFGLIAAVRIYDIFENIIYRYNSIVQVIVDLIIIVLFALAGYSALKGFHKKVFLIIATVVGIVIHLFYLISFFQMIEWYLASGMSLYLFIQPSAIIGAITLYLALLVFGLNNRIPAIIAVSPKKVEKMNPEMALQILKDNFELGKITEEEYKTKRAEIIEKL